MKKRYLMTLLLAGIIVLNVSAQNDGSGWMERDSLVESLFGLIQQSHLSSSRSTVKGEKLRKSFTQNVLNTLYGELPGLTVMQGSGEPGSDSPTLTARGIGTFSATSRSDRKVLVIVDGFESTMDYLNVEEIESVSLLKDAAATAIYGMKAANGVLLVTTKRGKVQPLEINFNFQLGLNTPQRMPKILDSYGYATLYNEARANDGLTPYYDEKALEAYRTGSNPYLYPNVDWTKEVLKNTSFVQNYDLNFRGGNNVMRYFALVNISDNRGFFKDTDHKQDKNANSHFTSYNFRANIDVDITDELSAYMRMGAAIQNQVGPAAGAWSMYNKIANTPPNAFPVYNPNGSYGGNATYSNPVGDLLETGLNSYNSRNVQMQLRLRYDLSALTKGLSAHGGVAFNNYFIGYRNKSRKYQYFSLEGLDDGSFQYNPHSEETNMTINENSNDQWRNTSANAGLTLSSVYGGKHAVDATAEWFVDEITNFNDLNSNTSLKDREFPYKYIGGRGHVSYTYDDRYTADFAASYMGTDLYASGHRFGWFPAGSLGWTASNEKFLKENKVISYLKLRTSYGLVGNAAVMGNKRYAYLADYGYTEGYYKGTTNASQSGIAEGSVANPNLTWEKEKRFNIGFDATMFDKLGISFDYFLHKRSDILTSPSGEIPAMFGISYTAMNLGKTTNKGFEAQARYADKLKNGFEYYAQFNGWYAKDRIDYEAEEPRAYPNLVRTGHGIDQGFGLKAIGLFHDQADIDNSPVQTFGDVKPGDIKYLDVNGDNQIDNQDVTAIGNTSLPRFSGSLVLGAKYKGFDAETMLYGVAGRTVYLSGNTYWAFMNQYSAPISAEDRWTEDNPNASYPRLSTMANPNNTQFSSFWQHDGSFLKIRYLEIGYTLPERIANKILMKNVRVFLNGTNLFRLCGMTGMKNADPEGLSGMPAMRTYSLGFQLKF